MSENLPDNFPSGLFSPEHCWSTGAILRRKGFEVLLVFVQNDSSSSARVLMEMASQRILIRKTWRTFWDQSDEVTMIVSFSDINGLGLRNFARTAKVIPVKLTVNSYFREHFTETFPGCFLRWRTAKIPFLVCLWRSTFTSCRNHGWNF